MNYFEFNCHGTVSWTMTEKGFIKIKDKDLIPPHMMRNVDIHMPAEGDDVGFISICDMYDRKKTVFFSYEEREKAEEVFKKILENDWVEKYDSVGESQSEKEDILARINVQKADMSEVSRSIEEGMRASVERNSPSGASYAKGKREGGRSADALKKEPIHDKNRVMISTLTETAESLEQTGERTYRIILIITIIELIGSLISGIVTAATFENFWLFLLVVGSAALWSAAWIGAAVGIKAALYRQALIYRAHAANLKCSDEILKKIEEK